MIDIYIRKDKKIIQEEQYGSKKLSFLYNTIIGRMLLKIIINPFVSKLYGIYSKSIFSKHKIQKLINNYNISLSNYMDKTYKSYNDFFTRELKDKNIICKKNELISPAESKLIVYRINNDLKINIKDSIYTLDELIDGEIDSSFKDGYCLIFRLSMDNYHRYCFVNNGEYIQKKYISGKLHTVCSISNKYKIYKENKRCVSKLKTDYGIIYQIEVGALLVGKIVNNNCDSFFKGEEKGHFEIGGSTIVLLLKNNVKIDQDIIKMSNNRIETLVKYGEKIGVYYD